MSERLSIDNNQMHQAKKNHKTSRPAGNRRRGAVVQCVLTVVLAPTFATILERVDAVALTHNLQLDSNRHVAALTALLVLTRKKKKKKKTRDSDSEE